MTSHQPSPESGPSRLRPASAPAGSRRHRVAAIIPAHNEAGRIGQVLDVLHRVERLDEIIAVDDGSTDGTATEAAQLSGVDPRLRVLRLTPNQGKGAALRAGAQATSCGVLLLLDADLMRLEPQHVSALLEPVLDGRADMTLGLFQGGQWATDLSHWLTPWLTGQRCLRARLLDQVSWEAAAGYGFETSLTLAARRHGWRCQPVPLRGVIHPPSEFHRGLRHGIRTRAKMYGDILRAVLWERGWRLRWPKLRWPARLAPMLMMTLFAGSQAYNRSLANSPLRLQDLPPLPLAHVERMLVVAPHPDDETLGAGGAIQSALALGAEVRVVVLTNGDGQALAPLALQGQMMPRPASYVASGELRQAETLAALRALGLPAASVSFLGYPDGALNQLWLADWATHCPIRAEYTRADRSPYPLTFDPQSTYCGRDLLADLSRVISDFKPDLVLLPHPNDEHPDHRAAGNFARLALALAAEAEPNYRPDTWGYLVHYGYYPQPRGLHPEQALLPPVPLSGQGNEWARIDLDPDQVQAKVAALRAHASQQRLLGSFLPSFARRDEIFVRLQAIRLLPLALHAFPTQESGLVELPAIGEPARESTGRLVVEGADLIGWQIGRLGDQLWLTAEARGPLLAGLHYQILIKTPDGRTRSATWPGSAERTAPGSFTVQLDLAEEDSLPVLGFAAEVREGATLDRTGWHFLILRNGLP